MKIRAVDPTNLQILLNLMQAYEAEFSDITKKRPAEDGLFPLDTQIDSSHQGWLLYDDKSPIGFAITGTRSNRNDVSEFYIIPSLRKQGIGKFFAKKIFSQFSGPWQVRQIAGAGRATAFWRKAIGEFTKQKFHEKV